MNKRFMAILAFVVAFSVLGQSAGAHTLSVQAKDKYLLGKGIVGYDGPVVQTDLYINLPYGFYADVFWSVSADNNDLRGDYGDELDGTFAWLGRIGRYYLDLGVSYFDLTKLFTSKGGDVLQPYLELGRSFELGEHHLLTPYTRAEVQIPVGWTADAHKGVHLFGGVKYSWKANERLTVSQKLALMYDTGTYVGFDHGFLGVYDVGLNWKLTDAITVNLPTLKVIFPISNLDDERETQHAVGGGVTFTF